MRTGRYSAARLLTHFKQEQPWSNKSVSFIVTRSKLWLQKFNSLSPSRVVSASIELIKSFANKTTANELTRALNK